MERDTDALALIRDEALRTSGATSTLIWERQLETEYIFLPDRIRTAAEKYVKTIIELARSGKFNPNEYAEKVKESTGQRPPIWQYYSIGANVLHKKMIIDAETENDKNALETAKILDKTFLDLINSTGLTYEFDAGRFFGHLISKLRQYPINSVD